MRLKLKESFNPKGYTNVITAINAGVENDTDKTALQKYLQDIINYCKNMASDYDILIEGESTESTTETSSATQSEDIAKKPEYKKMVTPDFKVGKRIKDIEER